MKNKLVYTKLREKRNQLRDLYNSFTGLFELRRLQKQISRIDEKLLEYENQVG